MASKHIHLQLAHKRASIQRVLLTRERLPGYHKLKNQKVLPALKRAMEKVGDGSYGVCDDCHEQISAARLAAARGATRCIACQTEFEKRTLRLPTL